jgi:hypothetical protein
LITREWSAKVQGQCIASLGGRLFPNTDVQAKVA